MNAKLIVTTLLFLLFISFQPLIGQQLEYPSFRIGVTPTALANFYPGVQLSFDKGFKQTNIEFETAYIFDSPFNARGFRIRPGIERLLSRGEKIGFSVGLHVNYRWSLEYRNIIRQAPNGEFLQFFYKQKRTRHYIGPIASFKLIHKPWKRWMYEVGIGFGLANYTIAEKMPLEFRDRFEFGEGLLRLDDSFELFGMFNFHVNFSYILKE